MAEVDSQALRSRRRVGFTGAGPVAIVFLLLAGTAWTAPGGVGSASSATGSVRESGLSVADRQVAAATSSLDSGLGPAAVPAVRCVPSTGSGPTCPSAALPLAPPLSPSSGVWTDLTNIVGSNVPSSRWIPTMAYDPIDHYVVLFGGYGGTWDGDTWTYANGVWTELNPNVSPPARYGATMTWDAHDGVVLLFGGLADTPVEEPLNDTWTFVHGQWTNVTANSTLAPQARWRAVMVFDPIDQYVVLFGGTNFSVDSTTETTYGATWTYADGNWTDIQSNVTGSPPGTYRAEATWDAADGYLVMFGGCTSVTSSTCATDDTYTYVNDTWTDVTHATAPNAAEYVGIAYDAAVRSVILFGGTNGATFYASTWSFSAGVWTKLSPALAPSARAYVGMTYDGFDGYLLVFGGALETTGDFLNETWSFGPSIVGTLQESSPVIDLGQSATLNATPLVFSGYVSYNWTALPDGCAAGNVSVVVCTPVATGTFPVNVSVNDSHGIPANRSANLTVNSDPEITGFSATRPVVTVGTSTVLELTVNSGGTTPYSFSYASLPPGCSSVDATSLTCTPTAAGGGSFTVNVTLRDSVGWRSYANVSLTVNAKPSLLSIAAVPGAIDLGQSSILYANATGGTAPLTYVYTNLPVGCTPADLGALSCTPSAVGNTVVGVNVSDVYGWYATGAFPLTVNPDPTGTFAASTTALDVGRPLTLWLNASGGTGTFLYQYSGLPGGCDLGAVSTGSCTPMSAGTYTIIGNATDAAGKTVTNDLTVTVNALPTIASALAAPSAFDVGQPTWINLTESGGTAPLTYSFQSVPPGCTSSNTVAWSCQPTSVGTFKVGVTVTDRFGTSSKAPPVVLTVNPDPVIDDFTASVTPAPVNAPTLLMVVTTGGTGPFSYAYSGLPAGCTTTDAASLNCTPSSAGTFNITVTVTDHVGEHQQRSLELTVTSPPSSGGTPILGQSGGIPWVLVGIGLLVLIAVVAGALLVLRRRRSSDGSSGTQEPDRDAEAWRETE